ncbi:MAG: HIT family protein [Motilibacteraceae bacterium]
MSTRTECVFCTLMETGEARWVHRGEDAVAFLPLPEGELAPGHTLVVPREHAVGVQDVSPEALASTSLLVQRVSHSMRDALGAPGVVVLNASGPSSGQSVDHLHFHVVPCWPDDGTDFWPVDRSSHPAIADVHQLLANAMQ